MILLVFLNSLAPAFLIAAIAWVSLRALCFNAATRYWAWWGVLAAVFALPFWPVREQSLIAMPELAPATPVEVTPGTDWFEWAAIVWSAFMLYRMIRLAVSYARLRNVRHNARAAESARLDELRSMCSVNRPTRLLISDEIASPIAVGFLHPSIMLPEGLLEKLTPAELDHLLLHELAHIARRDDWTNLAARLAGAFLGLHPVIAFALARIEKERELACDDWVVAATGEARPYAASLARIFELTREYDSQPLASGITGSRLGDRVEQLLTHGRRFTRDASLAAVILMAVALAVIVVVGAQSPAWVAFAQEPVPPVPPIAPVAQNPPVVPIPLVVPPAPPAAPPPIAPITPASPNTVEARLREFEAQMRAQQAQMTQAERDQQVQRRAMRESLRAQEAALKAELEVVLKQLEEVRREKLR